LAEMEIAWVKAWSTPSLPPNAIWISPWSCTTTGLMGLPPDRLRRSLSPDIGDYLLPTAM